METTIFSTKSSTTLVSNSATITNANPTTECPTFTKTNITAHFSADHPTFAETVCATLSTTHYPALVIAHIQILSQANTATNFAAHCVSDHVPLVSACPSSHQSPKWWPAINTSYKTANSPAQSTTGRQSLYQSYKATRATTIPAADGDTLISAVQTSYSSASVASILPSIQTAVEQTESCPERISVKTTCKQPHWTAHQHTIETAIGPTI